MIHRLQPLLAPSSIAVLGASRRDGVGHETMVNLLQGGFGGRLYAVNPGYDSVEGVQCYASLAELPETVEHVIFALSDSRIEAAFEQAIRHGAKACTIYSALTLENDQQPPLKDRIQRLALDAGVLLAGGNGMGFYNIRDGFWNSGFDTRHNHRAPGCVTLLSQSGAGMCGILDCEERLDFNFAASTGQELVVGMEDYLDWALDQPETRVVGMFMETSRQPEKLIAALAKAVQRQIPIVVVKVGRSELAAELAVSHSGALAGTDASYQAVFDAYGVQRVEDMDQLATALIMFSQPHTLSAGGVVSLHDSGGERQLIIDLAEKLDVPLTKLSLSSKNKLANLLDPGLPAVNPLDAWGSGGEDSARMMGQCFTALLQDPEAALGAVVHDRAPHGKIYSDYIDYIHAGHRATGKPVFLVASRQGTGSDEQVVENTRRGFPVIDGVSQFLIGAKAMLAYRDFLAQVNTPVPVLDALKLEKWRTRLTQSDSVDEYTSSLMLADFGIPMVASQLINDLSELNGLLEQFQYPVVLKTAAADISHKSDVGGVVLGLADKEALLKAYNTMSISLGPRILVAPMIESDGVEMILGVSRDEQFGPMIVVGFGGIYAEILQDVTVLKPPFDARTVSRALEGLKLRALLDKKRGQAAMNVDALCDAAARLSVLAIEFSDLIGEVDVNPFKLSTAAGIGLDSLMLIRPDIQNVNKPLAHRAMG
ncbi:MAG: acetate--CoA ligase family protein [Pseudomonadales bacterium]